MFSPAQPAIPSRPSLMKSLMAGFDAISAHIGIILLPVLLDVTLWLGPRLRLAKLFESALQDMAAYLSPRQDAALIDNLFAMLGEWNLLSSLRTFPVGVPSLMVSRLSLETPWGRALTVDLASFSSAGLIWLVCILFGLAVGTFYFLWAAQAAIADKVDFRSLLRQWPFTCLQLGVLSILWTLFSFIAFLPFACLLSVLLFGGPAVEQWIFIAGFLYMSILIFGIVPLVFSIHGVVARGEAWPQAIRESVRISYFTMPTTSFLFLVLVLLSFGLDILWNVPQNSSWWAFVGVVGHAYVATSLIAASFVYYHEAYLWVHSALQQAKSAPRWSEK